MHQRLAHRYPKYDHVARLHSGRRSDAGEPASPNAAAEEIIRIVAAGEKPSLVQSGTKRTAMTGIVPKDVPMPMVTTRPMSVMTVMYNNGPVTASSFSFQKRTAVPIKEAVAAFLLYFQSPLAVFLDFNSFPNILRPEFPLCSTHAYGILCGQRQSLAKAAPAKDLSFLDTQIQPAKSHFARQNHTAVVTTKTMYYYSCFFRRYPVK